MQSMHHRCTMQFWLLSVSRRDALSGSYCVGRREPSGPQAQNINFKPSLWNAMIDAREWALQLKQTFKVAMAQWHPDRYSTAAPEQQARAEEVFKILNQWSQKL